MENDKLWPFYAIIAATAFGIALSLVNYATERHAPPRATFDQRWPLTEIPAVKGDRLDRPAMPRYNWLANPFAGMFRIT